MNCNTHQFGRKAFIKDGKTKVEATTAMYAKLNRSRSRQTAGHDGLNHCQQVFSSVREFVHYKLLTLFNLLAFGDVVKAIKCSGDFSAFVRKRTDIRDDDNSRAVGPLDGHLRVKRCRYFARDNLSNR
jgi:hypothetical protein